MNKIIVLLIFLILLFSGIIDAQNNHSIGAGITFINFDYKEKLTIPLKSTESGTLTGWHFFYRYHSIAIPFFIGASCEYAPSDVKYNGSTQAGDPATADVQITLFRSELTTGYKIFLSSLQDLSLEFYSGFGFRSWKRGSILDDDNFFPEYYTWWEIPIGAYLIYDVGNGFQIGTDVRGRFMASGTMEVDISSRYHGTIKNFKVDLGNKPGFKLQIPFNYDINDRFRFTLSPWYEYSAIGKSNTVPIYYDSYLIAYAYEPSSSTNQFGLTFDAQISFR